MRAAEFESLRDAAIYRKNHGGWLFVTDRVEAFWFDAAVYTPTAIMLHPLTRGKTGTLHCDNRYINSEI